MLYSPAIYCLMPNAKEVCGQSLDVPNHTENGVIQKWKARTIKLIMFIDMSKSPVQIIMGRLVSVDEAFLQRNKAAWKWKKDCPDIPWTIKTVSQTNKGITIKYVHSKLRIGLLAIQCAKNFNLPRNLKAKTFWTAQNNLICKSQNVFWFCLEKYILWFQGKWRRRKLFDSVTHNIPVSNLWFFSF